jgi:translation initiation factor 1 (eIF-1/SUI1)
MSAWVLVLVVMATSATYAPFDVGDKPSQNVGIQISVSTYAPNVVTIEFGDEAACETAAKTLKDADSFGTTKAVCIARK